MPVRQNSSFNPQNSAKRIKRDSMKIESTDGNTENKDRESTSGGENDYVTDEQQVFQPAI